VPFEKGNPGKPKGAVSKPRQDIRDISYQFAVMCPKTLWSIAADKNEAAADRINAMKELMDRTFGKAKIAHSFSGVVGTYDLTRLRPEQLDQLETILIDATPASSVGPPD
jgi:hypothetical protein